MFDCVSLIQSEKWTEFGWRVSSDHSWMFEIQMKETFLVFKHFHEISFKLRFEINRLFVLFRCLYWWPAGGSKHQTSLHKCTVLLHPHDQTEHSEACWAQGGAAAPGNQTHTKPGGIQVPSEFILKNYLLILTDRQKERQTGADHQSSKTTKTKWSRSNNFYFPLNSFMSCCDIIAMLAVTSWLWCHLLVLLAFWMKLME